MTCRGIHSSRDIPHLISGETDKAFSHLISTQSPTLTLLKMRFKSTAQDNPWLTSPSYSSLVPIGTHSLWASITGPPRPPTAPLLIFITGAGGASALHIKLQQQLTPYIRCLFYDRAGYNLSTLPPLKPSLGKIVADDTARDLTKLLAATGLEPPYLLIAHSFGGIIARTFLQHHSSNPATITGMLLFDTATELMLSPLFPRFPPPEIMAVAQDVDYEALTHLQRDSGLSDAEWDYALLACARCRQAQEYEDTHASAHNLSLHRQLDFKTLGSRPLTVVRCNIAADMQFLYDEGVRLGGGSELEREAARLFISKCRCFLGQIQRAQWGLSEDVCDREFVEWGHDLPIRRPGIVVWLVRELMERMERKGGRGDGSGDVDKAIAVDEAGHEAERKMDRGQNVSNRSFPHPVVSFFG
ncbi:alpha/beta-hydrolase [Decorospora gaudefroyi]|uniref:Alpha/beta-hydrolase n=1 Tax=Decorospora gaudefroyi TaxID=184978 RepID=A0A6A5K192_9PLEO|nr:alpha/beta-hydrolase [Decorospora gaudefroyi]